VSQLSDRDLAGDALKDEKFLCVNYSQFANETFDEALRDMFLTMEREEHDHAHKLAEFVYGKA
jgi:rubrerythrin